MGYVLLTTEGFIIAISIVVVFSVGVGYWAGVLKGRSDKLMRRIKGEKQ